MAQNDFNFNSIDVIKYIIRQKKPLLIVVVVAFVVSTIVSFLLEPKYKSTVIMFPSSSTSISKTLLSSSGVIKESLVQFGEEEETERLLQVLNSDVLRNRIIQHFDLFNHYKIKTSSRYPLTTLIRMYKSNFQFKRTKFMAIEIKVYDSDPQMAADMANFAALYIDTIMNNMYKERARRAFEIVENEYLQLEKDIKSLRDSMGKISRYGICDYESQSEVFNAEYAKCLAQGNYHAANILKDKLVILQEHGGSYLAYKNLLEYEMERLSKLKARYAEAKVDAFENIQYKYILDNAYKAEKKSFPNRKLIVLVSVLSAFVLALFILIILDFVKSQAE